MAMNKKTLTEILVDIPFALTVKVLLKLGRACHLTYNAVNIIVWYILLPLAWAAILDYKLHITALAPAWLLLCTVVIVHQRKQWNRFCDKLFRLSQKFILYFGDYYRWSVIICLLVPCIITALLILW